jgi:flagellar assembly factor FliW
MEYDEESVLRLPRGLFGFESETRFLPIEQQALRPIVFLQSLNKPELCFISLPVFVVDESYELSLDPEELAAMGLPADRQPSIGSDVLCLALISMPEDGRSTANLLAPVVVNLQTREGAQVISSNPSHSHRHGLRVSREAVAC